MATTGKRRIAGPLVLLALLLLGVGGAVALVAGSGHSSRPADGGDAAARATDVRIRRAEAPAGGAASRAPRSVPAPVGGGGTPPGALPAAQDTVVPSDRAAVEEEARRRVFDDSRGGESPQLGTAWRGAGGTFAGVGNRELVTGRVIDAATGEAIPGAEIVVLTLDEEGWGKRVRAATATADGTFSVPPPLRHADRGAVLVRAPGHAARRAPLDALPGEWSLQPLVGSERGTIRGHAETPDGAPLHGMLLIAIRGEHGDAGQQYAWCDVRGSFELAGLHAGRWRLSLGRRREHEVETTVVAAGVASARLVADRPDAPPPERPGEDRRTVEVTGLADGLVVRAEAGRDVFWRAVVANGAARLELPLGNWVLTLDRADASVMPISVRADDALRRLPWRPDTGGRWSSGREPPRRR